MLIPYKKLTEKITVEESQIMQPTPLKELQLFQRTWTIKVQTAQKVRNDDSRPQTTLRQIPISSGGVRNFSKGGLYTKLISLSTNGDKNLFFTTTTRITDSTEMTIDQIIREVVQRVSDQLYSRGDAAGWTAIVSSLPTRRTTIGIRPLE
ncbi:hypothetical protein QJS10_CPA05g01601 [Acorus calamus]|uniref:Uncharacterized protein n=1 Tax=Acorus calamus TaxID=4465 RepID=A0AAV9EYC7_ACOCL|nr:hypothetical protein QJS10_CPA05g01601 [Acorus calamus]